MPNGLAETVRDKLRAGTLPCDQPLKVWAGIGSGMLCTVCDKPIPRAQTEYEAHYYDKRPLIRFHVGCFGVWEAERRRRVWTDFKQSNESRQ